MRRLAALLALIALIAMPLRTVGACLMPQVERAASDQAAAHEHMHHAPESAEDAPTASQESGVPDDSHRECPDLSGCAAVALGAADVAQLTESSGARAPASVSASLLDGPRTALDPPPPRR